LLIGVFSVHDYSRKSPVFKQSLKFSRRIYHRITVVMAMNVKYKKWRLGERGAVTPKPFNRFSKKHHQNCIREKWAIFMIFGQIESLLVTRSIISRQGLN